MSDLASAIQQSAQRLGIDPTDLATAISYETAGTFDPWKRGPVTKWGQMRGFIQMGEPQRAQFGYQQGATLKDQMRAVEKYLVSAGLKPGMGMLDLYSAINAGGVGRYNRSDAANGGAPGTVRDKVEQQMGGHRLKAERLLGGQVAPAPTANPGEQIVPQYTKPTTGALPVSAPEPALSALASMFTAAAPQPRAQQADEQAAEQARKQALFGDLGRLYG